jgi:hypothetical protein
VKYLVLMYSDPARTRAMSRAELHAIARSVAEIERWIPLAELERDTLGLAA